MAKQVFGFISDGDEYEFLIHKKDGHSHHEIRDLNALHRIPVSEITKNPQEYVYNKNLLIKVHGVSYNYKVATYVIVALLEDKNLEENVWDESTLDIYQENEEEFHGLDSWSKYSSRSPNSNMLSSISSKVAKSSSHVFTETPPKSMERSQRSSKVKKSLRLNSDQLHSLNLKPGVNTITYTIHSSLQSTQQISANIYLWEANSKIIVTDIDGTVTK